MDVNFGKNSSTIPGKANSMTPFDQFKNSFKARRQAGHCLGCGASFTRGGEDAELLREDGSSDGRLCFWCFDAEVYDPYDPQPSRYQYGQC
jgi:hypothetical protein